MIVANRKALVEALAPVAAVCPTSSKKEILYNVLCEIGNGALSISATDLETSARISLPVESNGTTSRLLINGAKLSSVLKSDNSESVSLDPSIKTLGLKFDKSKFSIPLDNQDDYPAPSFSGTGGIAVATDKFAAAIRRTSLCTDPASTRFAFGGILLEAKGGKLIACATDSKVLAVCSISDDFSEEFRVVVPPRACKIAAQSQRETIEIQATANEIFFHSGDADVSSRLIEGRFPRWQDVIPKNQESRVSVSTLPLLRALEQCNLFTTDDSRAVEFKIGDNAIALGRTGETGEAASEVIASTEGPKVSVDLDPRFVIGLLRTVPHEATIEMRLVDANAAVLFEHSPELTFVVMPLARD